MTNFVYVSFRGSEPREEVEAVPVAASRRRKEFLSYQPTIGGSVCEQQQHPGGGSLVATAVIESSISFGEETETNDDDDNESSSTDNNAAVERGEGHYFVTVT